MFTVHLRALSLRNVLNVRLLDMLAAGEHGDWGTYYSKSKDNSNNLKSDGGKWQIKLKNRRTYCNI